MAKIATFSETSNEMITKGLLCLRVCAHKQQAIRLIPRAFPWNSTDAAIWRRDFLEVAFLVYCS